MKALKEVECEFNRERLNRFKFVSRFRVPNLRSLNLVSRKNSGTFGTSALVIWEDPVGYCWILYSTST